VVKRLQEQVAIVTGGSRGVGRVIAEGLASEGAAVALAARGERDLADVARSLPRSLAVSTDVTSAAEVNRLVESVECELGAVTLLVAGAGSWDHVGPSWEGDPNAWWRDVEVSLRGAYLCARAVLPSMIDRHRGRVVCISSYAANGPRPYFSGYACGKAALLRFVDSLAAEVAQHGVSVFAVTPGFVRTKLVEEVATSAEGRRWLPLLAERQESLERERIGRLVVELASGRGDALTGRFLHVDDALDDLIARTEEIVRDDLYALRFRRSL
jgi:NAD(P)-dependent dehydrogenase (short-subunit alcohol dehydrogenase family)